MAMYFADTCYGTLSMGGPIDGQTLQNLILVRGLSFDKSARGSGAMVLAVVP
jgi:hypothetical protein